MNVVFTAQFRKDLEKAKRTYIASKIRKLIAIVKNNPFQTPPPYEKLRGYPNSCSRRINEQHRLVYIVSGDTVEFTCCWGHYE